MASAPIPLRRIGCALALAAAPLLAQAAPVYSLTALSNTNGSAPGGSSNVMSPGSANGGDFFGTFNGTSGSTFFHTYGFANPVSYFGARVSGNGTFYGKTTSGYSDSFTNLTAGALLVSFTFNVDSGQLAMAGAGTGFADLDLILKFNGSTVARDHTRVDGTTCNSFAGQDVGVLAGYQTCTDASNASGASHSYTVSQLVLAGQSLNIDYLISSEVSGIYTGGGATYCSGGGGIGLTKAGDTDALAAQVPNPSGCQFFNVLARSGDPASFGTPPFVNANFAFSSVSASVPEPGSLALATLALVALGGLRRGASATRRA